MTWLCVEHLFSILFWLSCSERLFGCKMATTAAAPLMFPVVLNPVLKKLEIENPDAVHILRRAFAKADQVNPAITFDFIMGLLGKADLQSSVNMNETLLKLVSVTGEMEELTLNRTEGPFLDLNMRAMALKKILSKIPSQINNRQAFLETIKAIASSIKKFLDGVNGIFVYIPAQQKRLRLEQRKKDFVRYSKKFSNTLKEFFKDGHQNDVFVSANDLITQTNITMKTIKSISEWCDYSIFIVWIRLNAINGFRVGIYLKGDLLV